MREVFERTIALIEEGTLPVIAPLILVCGFMWVLIFERIHFLFGTPLALLWPPLRKRMGLARDAVAEAFDAFLERRTEESRYRLMQICQRTLTPYSRFLVAALGRGPVRSDPLVDLRLAEAGLRAQRAIERGLLLISTLAKSAPLLGLLGTVTGMIQTFRIMMFASTSDPRALSSGISIALIATEVGLVVSLSGVVSSSWLNRRAETIEGEIHHASARIQKEIGAPSQEVAV